MADRYTEITHKGWLQNISESFMGALFGFVLFCLSFLVLWWNEGRVNPASIAKQSIPLAIERVEQAHSGQFVSVSGPIESTELLGDEWLKPAPYILLMRRSEMYAWTEHKHTETRKEVGGGTTEITTYSYEKKWTEHPSQSAHFKHSVGHENPTQAIKGARLGVKSARIGAYVVDPSYITLPGIFNHDALGSQGLTLVPLTSEKLMPNTSARIAKDYLFRGTGSVDSPVVGDIRIRYYAIEQKRLMTAFGKLDAGRIVPYAYAAEHVFCQIRLGNRDEAIVHMASEFTTERWILRGIGFGMMTIGILLLSGPIHAILGVLPLLSEISSALFFVISLVIAFGLSSITILLSMIFHNIWLLLMVVIVFSAFIFYGYYKRKRKHLMTTSGG